MGTSEAKQVLPDARLEARYTRIVEKLATSPADSFPDIMDTPAELEAFYRFVNNDGIEAPLLIARAAQETVARARLFADAIVAHDTTEFGFSTMREGLGRVTDSGRGCFAHFGIAVTADSRREPLGVVGLETFTRHGPSKRKNERHSERREESERESARWWRSIVHAEDVLSAKTSCIHVMDREADSYLLFTRLARNKFRFVSRIKSDRRVEADDSERLFELMAQMEASFTREVMLSAREVFGARKTYSSRDGRLATLEVAAGTVTLKCPTQPERSDETLPGTLTFNVVHVREVNVAPDLEPVDWKLITSEPVDTPAEIERVIDAYRGRWRIEEFFKALKTGCSVEKRQLESASALLNAIALFAPVAINLLRLRQLARQDGSRPASEVLRPIQIRILEVKPEVRLAPQATVRQAMLAIARLGGHIKQNGDPGWIVLGRGYEKLLGLEAGARLAVDLGDVINP
jgi:hypothetical protein